MAQRAAAVAVVLLVVAAVLLCAATQRLIWFVLAGVLLAVAYWFPGQPWSCCRLSWAPL